MACEPQIGSGCGKAWPLSGQRAVRQGVWGAALLDQAVALGFQRGGFEAEPAPGGLGVGPCRGVVGNTEKVRKSIFLGGFSGVLPKTGLVGGIPPSSARRKN